MDGMMAALPASLRNNIQLFPEFVRQGQPNTLRPALEKLISFHDVDLFSGHVGYRAIAEFVPTIEQTKKLALFADLGEYIPFDTAKSEYIFFNSFQYWQAEFALGRWAQSEFGGVGSVFMPVYDSGYHLHSAFRQGVQSHQLADIEYVISPPTNDNLFDIKDSINEYLDKFAKERPSYVHAIFAGTEALEFMHLYHKRGLHKEIPLIVSPHMASYEMLREIDNLDMTFYSASMWDYNIDSKQNQRFKSTYGQYSGKIANIFALLGYEMGQALEVIYQPLLMRDYEEARKVLKAERIRTPRGERSFFLSSEYATPEIAIEKVSIASKQLSKMAIGQGMALPYDHFIFEKIHRENVSGWYNAYLCV